MSETEESLKALIEIQKMDIELDALRDMRGDLPADIAVLEQICMQLEAQQTQKEEELNGIQKFIEEQKALIYQAEEQLKKYEKQKDLIKNNREYESISNEIEHYKLETKKAERKIIDTQEEKEKGLSEWEILKKELSDKNHLLEEKKKALDTIVADNSAKETELVQAIAAGKKALDPVLATMYDRIRANYRNRLVVAPIIREACGGCFGLVPPQGQIEIRSHKKAAQQSTCDHCGRILVDEEFYDTIEVA